jgi:TM2 domain-containing membrane protein YozV
LKKSKGAIMALINCGECGKQISDQAAACPHCGAPVTGRYQPATTPVVVKIPKSRSTAVALAILLGGLGIHKFYLNQPRSGFWYAIFCWTFIPAIIGFFEGIKYLRMSDLEFQKRYDNNLL